MSGEGGEWVFINLDESMAKRQGLPTQLPVPKDKFEALAEAGLQANDARKWVSDFLNNTEIGKNNAWRKKNSAMVVAWEAFVDKGPLWERAQKAFAEGDFEKAIAALKKITVLDDNDHSAKLNLASALANKGEYEAALKHFKKIHATYAGDAEFHVAVAQVHVAMQNKDEATNEFVLALEAKPDHAGALEAMSKLGVLAKIYENPKDASSLLYVRADAVVDYLTGEWDKEARSLDFYLEQIAYHEREQRWAVVLEAAERAAKLEGDDKKRERAALAKVGALRSLGRLDDALVAAQAYVELAPSSSAAQVELARTLGERGDTAGANAAVDRALELDPGDLVAMMLKFWPDDPNDLQKVHAIVPALTAYAEANATVPNVWRTLARALLVVGRVEEAVDLLKKAVELSPADDDLRSELWHELTKQQRYQEILDDVAKLGDMKARDWRLRWNEGEAYAGLGKKMEARACFSAINFDESLHVDIRRRAKRAVNGLTEEGALVPPAG
jgi:tetratricopeptide (TPR) repeat protein